MHQMKKCKLVNIQKTQQSEIKKLHINFMKDLRNHEFVDMYENIINYIEKQQVDDVNINIAFEGV